MLAKVQSVTLVGIEAVACEVEVNVASRGFAAAVVVGMPEATVKESLERIRTAIANCGYDLTGNVSGRCPECGVNV